MTGDVETIVLERLQFAAMQTFSPAMADSIDAAILADIISTDLCVRLSVYVYGKKGPTATASRTFTEARLPRWLPPPLRRRWSHERTVQIDATPMLLFPDATYVPADKFGTAFRYVDIYTRDVEGGGE